MSPYCTKLSSCDRFAELPAEIVDLILMNVSKNDIIALRSTCRSYNSYFSHCLVRRIASESSTEQMLRYLQRAIKNCLHGVLALLLAEKRTLADMKTGLKETALHMAANENCAFAARKLVDVNANLEAVTKYGWTPLMEASRFGHESVIRILVSAKVAIDYQGFHGWTALHLAIRFGHPKVAQLLLEAGANPNLQDNDRSSSGCGKVKAWGAI
ncbi:hypothetical protein TWF225_009353 [Orbilia oligospora]|uniref:F-box domain-containing protein n=1 Tax=Orbilia oligospora TaxID=2813651 RepID=A0A7C8TRJ0_ORBOL|nr:hypothetical protein TWF751_001925 [Orbilia oligospora]KAF3193808.1 hypothetical protein TWF225_009353 [Orbilia oligospora]KAF3269992.1 hypothetical protein TWF217_008337 [Orbilia oligospora]KAF3270458.1 hypothetical protein TWF128_004229 [Orbilia oligospora]KAF3298058.1 hypothetical protein TWF132_004197 [Orbilia oligospora]